MRSRWLMLGVVVLLLAGLSISLLAARGPRRPEAQPPAVRAAQLGAYDAQRPSADPTPEPSVRLPEEPTVYGLPPKGAEPFRHFGGPYKRFFLIPLEDAGPVREEPERTGVETVSIGFLGPIKAPGKASAVPGYEVPYGQAMLRGCQLAIEQANAAGGYQGKPFVLKVHNDSGLWGATSNEVSKMAYDENCVAFLGSINGANTHIALRVALKIEIPMINSADTDPTLTETRIPWLMRVNPDDRHLSYGLAERIFRVLRYRRVAVLRANEDYCRRAVVEFRDTARRLGYPIHMEKRFVLGTRDFSPHLNDIKRAQVECVAMWGEPDDVGRAVKQMRQMGMQQPIFTGHRIIDPRFPQAAGDAAEGVVAASQWDPTRDDPKLKAFLQAYEKRFDMPADTWAAHAYDGMQLVIKAIGKAGLNRARIMDSLVQDYTLKTYQGVTGTIKFDHVLNDIGPVWLARFEGGKWVYEAAPRTYEIGLGAGLQAHPQR